jgi:prefoldin subunit 5
MNAETLRTNFNNQLKETEGQIAKIKGELEKLEEYKLKLQGGLETLELLAAQESEEEAATTAE